MTEKSRGRLDPPGGQRTPRLGGRQSLPSGRPVRSKYPVRSTCITRKDREILGVGTGGRAVSAGGLRPTSAVGRACPTGGPGGGSRSGPQSGPVHLHDGKNCGGARGRRVEP